MDNDPSNSQVPANNDNADGAAEHTTAIPAVMVPRLVSFVQSVLQRITSDGPSTNPGAQQQQQQHQQQQEEPASASEPSAPTNATGDVEGQAVNPDAIDVPMDVDSQQRPIRPLPRRSDSQRPSYSFDVVTVVGAPPHGVHPSQPPILRDQGPDPNFPHVHADGEGVSFNMRFLVPEGMDFPMASLNDLLGGVVGMPGDEPDMQRARTLLRGMEAVPKGLLQRLEKAGGVPGGAGDDAHSGCAVCWGSLTDDTDGIAWTEKKDATSAGEDEPEKSEKELEEERENQELEARIITLPCSHVFHASCLLPWFGRNTTCPTCRFDVDPESLTWNPPPIHFHRRPPPPPPAAPREGDASARTEEQIPSTTTIPQASQTQSPPQPIPNASPPNPSGPATPHPMPGMLGPQIHFDAVFQIIVPAMPSFRPVPPPSEQTGGGAASAEHPSEPGSGQQPPRTQPPNVGMPLPQMQMPLHGPGPAYALPGFLGHRGSPSIPIVDYPRRPRSTPPIPLGAGPSPQRQPQSPPSHPNMPTFMPFPGHHRMPFSPPNMPHLHVPLEALHGFPLPHPNLNSPHFGIPPPVAIPTRQSQAQPQSQPEPQSQAQAAPFPLPNLQPQTAPNQAAANPSLPTHQATANPHAAPHQFGAGPFPNFAQFFTSEGGPHPFFNSSPSPNQQRERKAWSAPSPVGKSLRQRVEEKERELGLRCDHVVCGLAPSDEDPELDGSNETVLPSLGCGHKFHLDCLKMSERIIGSHVVEDDDEVEVQCPCCRTLGKVWRKDWEAEAIEA